jgi:hypothetical protein
MCLKNILVFKGVKMDSLINLSFYSINKKELNNRKENIIPNNNFYSLLDEKLNGTKIESTINAESTNINKRKKETVERKEDYSFIAEDIYDVLFAEKYIRASFRKINLVNNA